MIVFLMVKTKYQCWNDNKAVSVATNYDKILPLSQVIRWSKNTSEPTYNKFMGGGSLIFMIGSQKGIIKNQRKKMVLVPFTRLVDIYCTKWLMFDNTMEIKDF